MRPGMLADSFRWFLFSIFCFMKVDLKRSSIVHYNRVHLLEVTRDNVIVPRENKIVTYQQKTALVPPKFPFLRHLRFAFAKGTYE